jgi:anti-sigma regulatory factor (Ser/Thr protein kinase)
VQHEGTLMGRDFRSSDRTWTLRPAADAPQRARRLVRSWLDDADPRAERAQLLVSELVTNVVHHVGSPMVVSCRRANNCIRIEVTDTSLEPPRLTAVQGPRGGYGLRIVDALSDAWGFEANQRGKSVWFEIRAEGDR